ncbi:MlaD family protein [Pontibacter sp. SGAir0037]|uniref:MlaD family protein n=1 Tax=Pontibacter sp. SGAir0037 TaxID=2571030 RepID=UPI0010CD19B5|nr:MlaD family protein [Pontibacter sp. SGAir0037]QCR24579.1 MCE family protein [Pontibacter sp. SGAir0037]
MKITKEIKVALLGIVALVLLYFGFMFLKGAEIFSGTKKFYVIYSNADGLTASNPVILNGVHVGTVQAVKLLTDKGNQIEVQIEVQNDLQIGDSTVASLANSDLLGSKAIILYMGNNTRQYNGGEQLIAYVEKSITDMLTSKAMPVLGTVDSTLVRVNKLLDSEAKDNIQQILANSAATTEALNMMLRQNQRNINDITSNISALTASLRQTERQINRLAMNMAEITDTLKQVEINKLVNNANDAVSELESAVAKLNSNEGSMGKLMNDNAVYDNLNRSTEALNLLLRDIQVNPKRYVHFSVFGRRDKYKVDATGRVITVEEIKEMQDQNPQDFQPAVPDSSQRRAN